MCWHPRCSNLRAWQCSTGSCSDHCWDFVYTNSGSYEIPLDKNSGVSGGNSIVSIIKHIPESQF